MKSITCPACRGHIVSTSIENDQFVFRSGGVDYPVTVEIPVHACSSCGESFVSEIGEIARHAAICRAMRRLTPQEIYALRHERLALSRKNFAALSGIGEASLARWESGELIQSESNDNLLRLLAFQDNVQALRDLRSTDNNNVVPPRHRATSRAAALVILERRMLDVTRYPGIRDTDNDRVMRERDRFQLKQAS
jgi:putative zinc finger/helix-turn-helix YgiT family protein